MRPIRTRYVKAFLGKLICYSRVRNAPWAIKCIECQAGDHFRSFCNWIKSPQLADNPRESVWDGKSGDTPYRMLCLEYFSAHPEEADPAHQCQASRHLVDLPVSKDQNSGATTHSVCIQRLGVLMLWKSARSQSGVTFLVAETTSHSLPAVPFNPRAKNMNANTPMGTYFMETVVNPSLIYVLKEWDSVISGSQMRFAELVSIGFLHWCRSISKVLLIKLGKADFRGPGK